MTTNTDGAMPELPDNDIDGEEIGKIIADCTVTLEGGFSHLDNDMFASVIRSAMEDYARAAIEQAAGAVPEGLIELLQSCRGSVKSDLLRYEQLLLRGEKQGLELTLIDAETHRLMMLLDSIDALAGREAGSSDHLVPCAGGGVTQPLTLAQIQTLYQQVQAEVAKLEDEGRYTFAGWFPIAVRLVEAAVWEAKK